VPPFRGLIFSVYKSIMGEFKNSELIYCSKPIGIYMLFLGALVTLLILSVSLTYVSTFFEEVLSSLLLD
jgi:hypothetical protein